MASRVIPQIAVGYQILHSLIEGENGEIILLFTLHCHSIQYRNIRKVLTVVFRGIHENIQRGSSSVNRCMKVRIINGLFPDAASVFRHDGGDDIYKLSLAGHLYTVRMAQEGNQHSSYKQRILKVIDIFVKGRPFLPFYRLFIFRECMVPYIPFIKGYVDFLFGTLLGLNIITGGNYVFKMCIRDSRYAFSNPILITAPAFRVRIMAIVGTI